MNNMSGSTNSQSLSHYQIVRFSFYPHKQRSYCKQYKSAHIKWNITRTAGRRKVNNKHISEYCIAIILLIISKINILKQKIKFCRRYVK